MTRFFITILIVAVLVNALVRAGTVALNYYELKDEAQQIARFGSKASEADLENDVHAKAMELNVPLEEEGILVSRDGSRTHIEVSYVEEVELFPRFRYPMNLSFTVEALSSLP